MSEATPADAGNTQATSAAQPDAAAGVSAAEGTPSAAASSADASTPQQGAEGQTGDTKPASAEGEGTQAKAGAPEQYEFKAPEGKGFDPEVIAAYSTVAKELDLPQDSAQKILDALAPKVAERFEARQAEALAKYKSDLIEQTKTDKELGGEKLSERIAVAEKALAKFGNDELRTLLKESGLANHPEVIRAFYKAGQAISEDRFVPGGKEPAKSSANPAKALYPTQA